MLLAFAAAVNGQKSPLIPPENSPSATSSSSNEIYFYFRYRVSNKKKQYEIFKHIVAHLLKARTVGPEKSPFLGNARTQQ
jgi:hypothetical protein